VANEPVYTNRDRNKLKSASTFSRGVDGYPYFSTIQRSTAWPGVSLRRSCRV